MRMNKTSNTRWAYPIVLSVLFFAAVFVCVPSALASPLGLTIQPVKIIHTLNPGESVAGTIALSNASEEDVRLEVKIEDFVPTAGSEGIQFVGRAPGVTTVRDWFSVESESEFIMEKGNHRNIVYKIEAPVGAEPGSHFGVIFFKANRLGDEGQLKVGTQVGVLAFVTVPGNRLQKGQILDFAAPSFVERGPVPFTMKFENTGTVHFEPRGVIEIKNILGKEVTKVPIAGQVVLPTGIKDLTVEWQPTGLILGRYQAKASIADGDGNVLTSETITFYAAPLAYIFWFILAIVVIFLILRFVKRRVRFSVSLNKPEDNSTKTESEPPVAKDVS